jgi:hypothetical protein
MKKNFLFLTALFLSAFSFTGIYGQQRSCHSMENLARLAEQDPAILQNLENIERHTENFVANGGSAERVVYNIPVVVHVLYNTTSENISDAQIQSQINILNADFRKLNADASSIPSVFAGVSADTEINFCLATVDPNGAATTGITRTSTTKTSFGTDDKMKYTSQGGKDAWNTTKYLNLWVCDLGTSLLGYAQFPGGAAATDGVVCNYTAFGNTGTAASPFNKGRTATHEVGHWLNLRHIWGDANCGSDLVSDTPTHNTSNYGCPSQPHYSTCSGSPQEMTMNYMDYTDDACMYMFTAGQKTRMQAVLASGGARASLATSNGCGTSTGGGTTTCAVPTGLSASSITSSGATLSWTAASGATSYNVQYKLSTATTWTTVTSTTTSKALTGLSASSTYNYQVSTVCSSGSSAYSTASSFTTLAASGGTTLTCTNYESNNTNTSATSVGVNSVTESFIGSSTDVDWFKFTTTTAAPKVKVQLTSLPGDYDIKLYRGTTLLGTSQNSSTTSEQLIYNGTSSAYTYYVKVYGYNSANSCTDSYLLTVSTQSGSFRLEDGSLQALEIGDMSDINLIPNPANDWVDVSYINSVSSMVNIKVYDIAGKLVYNQQTLANEGSNTHTIDLAQLNRGYYIVTIDNGKSVQQSKLAIMK